MRCAHWLVTVGFILLVVSGYEILMVHPRLYWGNVGNELTPAWVELPISRNYHHPGWEGREPFFAGQDAPVTESRTYRMFNHNSWGRSLHFLSAWLLVGVGVGYLLTGAFSGHFRRHLIPRAADSRYGVLQRRVYFGVVFIALPATGLTGFAMSPALTAAHPWLLSLWGGYHTARSVHFLLAVALVLFVVGHVGMVIKSGFLAHMRAMTVGTGRRSP